MEKSLDGGGGARPCLIRPIRSDDDDRIAFVIRSVMTEYGAIGEGYSIVDPEVDGMSAAYAGQGAAYFVATCGDEVVGGAGVGPLAGGPADICELKKMYVLPEGRGLGLGRQLMAACLAAARAAGYARCYLETLDRMQDARRLYERNGFTALDGPLGSTGHDGCNGWYLRDLRS
ncbi:MAG: GNAT family N-acetyltransferase [Gemmatimonadota bacterium]